MRYFDSYRLFHGKNSIKEYGAIISVNMAALIVFGVLTRVSENDFFRGFLTGFAPFVCGAVTVTIGFALVCGVSNGNLPANPGYRFFHSLADGAGHFRRALLFANVLSLFPVILYAAVGGFLFEHFIIVVMTLTALLMTGFLNLTCHIKSPWIRIVAFCVIGFVYGFYGGITGKDEDIVAELPMDVTVIVSAVILAFYIISVIIVTARAEALWSKEG